MATDSAIMMPPDSVHVYSGAIACRYLPLRPHRQLAQLVNGRMIVARVLVRERQRSRIESACLAAEDLRDATRALQSVTVSARRGDEQNRWLAWTVIGGIVVGMIAWAVFAGFVARAVPASWQWPERMAAHPAPRHLDRQPARQSAGPSSGPR